MWPTSAHVRGEPAHSNIIVPRKKEPRHLYSPVVSVAHYFLGKGDLELMVEDIVCIIFMEVNFLSQQFKRIASHKVFRKINLTNAEFILREQNKFYTP